MDLYFSPMACSLASRIALYEAGAEARYLQVDIVSRPKRVEDGADFLEVTPVGLVPVLRTDDGELILENAVVLQYLADRFPAAGLIAPSGADRRKTERWLSFIATELHAGAFAVLLSKTAPDAAKPHARARLEARLAVLDTHLEGREFLHGGFSVADAYLFVMLTWTQVVGLDLAAWPTLAAYRDRLRTRPAVARALGEEFALYQAAAA